MDKAEGVKGASVWNSVLVHFIHHLASPNSVLSLHLLFSKAMADQWKGKGLKATGQWKSAKQLADISNKENSLEEVVTTEWPKHKPLKKKAEPQHTDRNSSIKEESDDDEGAAMVAEALLTIQKGKLFLGCALSPMECIF